jgi:hypothetical protein
MEHYLHAGALIVFIQESNYHLAAQCPDRDQEFGGESSAVFGQKVNLNVIGASPPEMTEWALPPWPVSVLQVALELLDPCKIFFAIWHGTSRPPHLVVHVTTAVALGASGR